MGINKSFLVVVAILIYMLLFTTLASAVVVDNANLTLSHTYNDTDSKTRIGNIVKYFNTGAAPSEFTADDGTQTWTNTLISGWSGGYAMRQSVLNSGGGSYWLTSYNQSTSMSVSGVINATAAGTSKRVGLTAFSRTGPGNHYDGIVYDTTTDEWRIRKRVSDTSTTLASATTVLFPSYNAWYYYVYLIDSSNIKFKWWAVGSAEPDWIGTYARGDATYTYGSAGFWNDDMQANYDNFSVRNVVSTLPVTYGNITGAYNFGSGLQGSQASICYDLEDGSSVDAWASPDGTTWTSIATGITSCTLTDIPSAAKGQNQRVRAVLNGGNATSPAFINMTITSEAIGGAPSWVPGTPTAGSQVIGFNYINSTHAAGTGAVTDSFNISANNVWTNGTTVLYVNTTGLNTNEWQNLTIYGWNNSGSGNLSASPLTRNTQLTEPEVLTREKWQCIACYSFFENNGTNVTVRDFNDTNLNHGIFYANTTGQFDVGKKGRGLYFDYSNVTVPHSSTLNFTGEAFTVFFWAKYSQNMSDADLIRKGNSISALHDWKVEITDGLIHGTVGFYDSGTETYTAYDTSYRNDSEWHAITFQRNGTHIRLRVDGTWIASTLVSNNGISNNSAVLAMGAKGDPANASAGQDYYHGYLDEVRILDGIISDSDLAIYEEARDTVAMIPDSSPGRYEVLTDELKHDLDQILKRSPSGYVDAILNGGDADCIDNPACGTTGLSFIGEKIKSTARDVPIFFTNSNHHAYTPEDYTSLKSQYGQNLTPQISLINGPSGMENTTYSIDIGRIHAVMVNEYWDGQTPGLCSWFVPSGGTNAQDNCFLYSSTEGGFIPSNLRTWIGSNLNNSTAPGKIVMGHEPARPVYRHVGTSLDKNTTNRNEFETMLNSSNVYGFFAGHTHYFVWQYVSNLWQVTLGGIGATITQTGDDDKPAITYFSVNSSYKILTSINGSVYPYTIPNAWNTVTTNENATYYENYEISACRVIDTSGTYTVTADITNSSSSPCIDVTANNVIIEGAGYTIDGISTESSIGIRGASISNLTVNNTILNNWYDAIRYTGATLGNITNNTVTVSTNALYLSSSSNLNVSNNTISGDSQGVYAVTVSYSMFENNSFDDSQYGIDFISNNLNNTIRNNNITNNAVGNAGLLIEDASSNNNTIYNNFLNNTINAGDSGTNFWNVTNQTGPNIIGGSYIGGNAWYSPTGNGYSQTCVNENGDGFCDTQYNGTTFIDYLPLTPYNILSGYSFDVNNTGWQFIFVPQTINNSNLCAEYNCSNVKWILHYDAGEQRFHDYKANSPYRQTENITKGDGVMMKFTNNATLTRDYAAGTYTWNLSIGWNLLGNDADATKTLAQINTSINTAACEVYYLSFTNRTTGVESTFTCNGAGNATVEVSRGEGFWAYANSSVSKARSW